MLWRASLLTILRWRCSMAVSLVCPKCGTPLDDPRVSQPGVVHCSTCTEKLLYQDEALTYVDEMPVEEYRGG